MHNHWLSFLGITTLSIIVFAFFIVNVQPVHIPEPTQDDVTTITEPSITFVNPSLGPTDARVTIIEYGDFQCQACRSVGDSIAIIQRTYPNDVRFVFKHMPNESAHPLATPAAIASMCAKEQQAFWPYYEELFARQAFLSEEQFLQIAAGLNLNLKRFEQCISYRETLPLVKRDFDEGRGLAITATPTVFIQGERYVGALSTDELLGYVEAVLENE